jgi:transcriptional regulator with XRE-family HTH domain
MSTEENRPTIGRNLEHHRNARGLSLRKLSAALKEHGAPINADGLNRIEHGKRKVSTDELMALAVILDVSPVTLLLPDVDSVTNIEADVINTSKPVQLTENVSVPWETAWRWAHGTDQLPGRRSVSSSRFFEENRPYDRGMEYEIERVLMDQVPVKNRPAVVVGIVHDDARAPEVTIYTGANAEREARRRLADGEAG